MGLDEYRQRTIGGCCRDCKERYEACHDYCEKYRDARDNWQQHKQMVREAKEEDKLYNDYKYKRITKALIKKGKGVANGKHQ